MISYTYYTKFHGKKLFMLWKIVLNLTIIGFVVRTYSKKFSHCDEKSNINYEKWTVLSIFVYRKFACDFFTPYSFAFRFSTGDFPHRGWESRRQDHSEEMRLRTPVDLETWTMKATMGLGAPLATALATLVFLELIVCEESKVPETRVKYGYQDGDITQGVGYGVGLMFFLMKTKWFE